MKIIIEFDNAQEAIPFLQTYYPAPGSPPIGAVNMVTDAVATDPATPAKRTRRTKAEMEAAKAAEKPAAEPAPAGDFDDEPAAGGGDFLEDEPAAKPVTRDDVRAALVTYQERLTKAGKGVEDARATVLGLLKKVSGADKLGGCPDDKFAAVVDAANKAK